MALLLLCGPKLSMCCLLLSVWGVIQLSLMGMGFYIKSVALAEDLPQEVKKPLDDPSINKDDRFQYFWVDVDSAYTQNAFNCWVAASLYVVTFVLSAHQVYLNNRNKPNIGRTRPQSTEF